MLTTIFYFLFFKVSWQVAYSIIGLETFIVALGITREKPELSNTVSYDFFLSESLSALCELTFYGHKLLYFDCLLQLGWQGVMLTVARTSNGESLWF